MKHILLCSSNPILVKSLYAMLREEGHYVETVEHPAMAVHKVMFGLFELVILDSEPFGLSTEDAVHIIKTVAPDLPVICVGGILKDGPSTAVSTPVDLEEFKRTLHNVTI
jgi:DNA-binding NtrC family response regulator